MILTLLLIVACDPAKNPNIPSTGADHLEFDQDPGSGGRVGNGGSGVLCRTKTGKILSIEIFDFFEAKLLDSTLDFEVPFNFQTVSPLDQAVELARHVVNERIRAFDVSLADYLIGRLSTFKDETVLTEAPIPFTQDIEPLRGLTSNCRRIQLAFSREPDPINIKRFHVWKRPFEHSAFSPTNRAALILHELIYELTLLRGANNSVGTRAMISQIFSGQYRETFITREKYFAFANASNMPWAGFGRLPVKLGASHEFSFWDDEQTLREGHIIPGEFVPTAIGELRIGCSVSFSKSGIPTAFSFAQPSPEIGFHAFAWNIDSGSPQKFQLVASIKSATQPTGVADWNRVYRDSQCTSSGKFQVVVDTDQSQYFFEKISPAMEIHEETPFFKLDALVDSNIRIANNVVSGTSSGSGQGYVSFRNRKQTQPCEILSVEPDKVNLSPCVTKLFPYASDRLLSIESVARDAKYLLTIKLTKEPDQLISVSNSLDLLLKRGSLASFDTRGILREATVIKSTISVCVAGTDKRRFIDSPGGEMVRFDDQGCLIVDPK